MAAASVTTGPGAPSAAAVAAGSGSTRTAGTSPVIWVMRTNTSSRVWRPARRSASGRSRSASQPVRAAMLAGDGSAAIRYSPGETSSTAAISSLPSEAVSMPGWAPKRISRLPPALISSIGVPLVMRRPRSMITTRSATFSASSRSWVVSTTQTPSWASSRTRRRISWRPCTSTLLVGSSRNATLGRPTRASASDKRCCSPPESWRQVERRTWVRPTRSSRVCGSSGVA